MAILLLESVEKQWFVFYTKSRHEKKVRDFLIKKGYEPFLPLQYVVRQWSDRKKKVEAPLFNSYIFVQSFEHQIQEIVTVPGISWNVRHNGKPAVLRNNELELIKRFIETGLFIETASISTEQLHAGDKVVVRDGPLAGMEGVLEGEAVNQRFTVRIESIQQVIKVQVPGYLVEKI